jgi:hypothetical protein
MGDLLEAIAIALKSRNWYAALALALTIPDVCAALEAPNRRTNGEKYAAWFDEYLGAIYGQVNPDFDEPCLTGGDCYALRCAVLHQTSDDVSEQRARRIFERFRIQAIGPHLRHVIGGRIDGQYTPLTIIIGVRPFCEDMLTAARRWYVQQLTGGTAAGFGMIFKTLQIHTQEPEIDDL